MAWRGEVNLLAQQSVTGYSPSPIRIMLGLRSPQQPRVLMHGVSVEAILMAPFQPDKLTR